MHRGVSCDHGAPWAWPSWVTGVRLGVACGCAWGDADDTVIFPQDRVAMCYTLVKQLDPYVTRHPTPHHATRAAGSRLVHLLTN